MYQTDTILELKEQRDPDEETGEAFPYNRVRVVGPSPISYAGSSEWSGSAARGVIIEPVTNFGSNLDEPFGKLQRLYDIVETPVVEVPTGPPKIRVYDSTSVEAGPTPEDIFAAKAAGEPSTTGKRTKRRESPLGEDPRIEEAAGPLGRVEPNEDEKPQPVQQRTESPL